MTPESTNEAPLGALPHRFGRTVVTNYGSSIGGAVITLAMTPILARSLGPEQFGVWALVGGLAIYSDFLQLGLVSAGVKHVAESLGDAERLRRVLSTLLTLLSAIAVLALMIGSIFTAFFTRLFHVVPGLERQATILMLLTALVASLSLFGDTYVAVLAALQRYDLLNATLLLLFLLQAAAWGAAIATGGGLVALGIGSLAATCVFLALRRTIAQRLLGAIQVSRRLFDRQVARGLTSLSAWLALGQGSALVIFEIDTIVVGSVAGVRAAGIFVVGQRLGTAVDKLARPAMAGFFPHGVQLAARGDHEGLRRSLVAGTRISLAVAAPFALGLALFAGSGVRAWAGAPYAGASLVVVYLALAQVNLAFCRTGLMILDGSGRARGAAMISAVEAALNLGLSIALGLTIGLTGVALATLVASVVVRIGVFVPYMARTLGLSVRRLVLPVLRAHLAPVVAASLVGVAIRVAHLPDAVAFLVGGGAVVLVYAAVFVVSGLSPAERAWAADAARAIRARLAA